MLKKMGKLVYLLKKRKNVKKQKEHRPRGEYQRGGDQQRSGRPQRNNRSFNRDNRGGGNDRAPKETFEQKMARFLKDSEDRLTSLKRNTESKRGGRGARRG